MTLIFHQNTLKRVILANRERIVRIANINEIPVKGRKMIQIIPEALKAIGGANIFNIGKDYLKIQYDRLCEIIEMKRKSLVKLAKKHKIEKVYKLSVKELKIKIIIEESETKIIQKKLS